MGFNPRTNCSNNIKTKCVMKIKEKDILHKTEIFKFQLKPYPNEHAARINNPDKYVRMRRENNAFGNGIDVIWGILEDESAEVQAIRFDSDIFTPAQARAWLEDHNYNYIEFEEASGEEKISKHKKDKLNMPYPVKSGYGNQVKDVDLSKRIVQIIPNTYFYIDEDLDMLIPGVSKRSISQRGAHSEATAKIKHQLDHKLLAEYVVGKPIHEEETTIDGRNVLYAESKIPNTTKGNDHLINYQEGIYDNHSIGFRYLDLVLAEKENENELVRQTWDKYYPLAINPEKANEYGYFWVVKEIELFEYSVVSYGANSLTATLGVKSLNDKDTLMLALNNRMELLNKQLKSGQQSDDMMKIFELQTRQIKQIVYELINTQPSLKDTLKQGSSIKRKDIDYKFLINNI